MAAYTEQQLARYLAHIDFPVPGPEAPRTLAMLSALQLRQLTAVPFDSLALHYSPTRLLSLDLTDLLHKVTGAGGRRGGYCMENNTLFAAVLRGLGFETLSAGARVSHETTGRYDGGWTGWAHMVNLVRIGGRRHLVDVGFGGNGPCRPLPLDPERPTYAVGVAPQELRLEYTRLPRHTDPAQRVWVYSYRAGAGAPWVEAYCFTEVEFFADDFKVMNLDTMTTPQSFFVQTVMAQRFILADEARRLRQDDGEPAGQEPVDVGTGGDEKKLDALGVMIMVHDQMKWRIGTDTKLLETMVSEADRMAALKKYFGIVLSPVEQKSIAELASELRGGLKSGNGGDTDKAKTESNEEQVNGIKEEGSNK